MVWFQCEACGDELKKPKLANHFRQCSAYKLSCIDCGESFDQQTVQAHSQCITESEKYGPKGVGVAKANQTGAAAKGKPNKPDVDTSVGLSQRPPWFCSLCNTAATSQQALLIHADGKKHRAKSRAYAAKLLPNPPVVHPALTNNHSTQTPPNIQTQDHINNGASASPSPLDTISVLQNGNLPLPLNKRKHDTPDNTTHPPHDLPTSSKKPKQHLELNASDNNNNNNKQASHPKFKWKKLIASLLKSTPDGALKMKKLQKLVLKSLQESGIALNDSDLRTTLEHKVNSSSKYKVDGKYVRLTAV